MKLADLVAYAKAHRLSLEIDTPVIPVYMEPFDYTYYKYTGECAITLNGNVYRGFVRGDVQAARDEAIKAIAADLGL